MRSTRPFPSLFLFLCALLAFDLFSPASHAQTNAADILLPDLETAPPDAIIERNSYLTFGLDRIARFQREFPPGFPLWQYVASIIYILIALLLSRLLDRATGVSLRKWASRSQDPIRGAFVDLVRGPVRLVAFVILLHIGLRAFVWPVWLQTYVAKGLKLVVAVSLTYLGLKLTDLGVSVWRQKFHDSDPDQTFDQQLLPVIRKALKVFITIVAILLTSDNLGLNITSLIASVSIGGLAIGLAAQDTLGNLFGAVAIFLDKPFRVGDRVQLDPQIDGVVESIGLRSTRIRNLDGHLITVPNKTMGNAVITNITLRPNIKTALNIGLPYDTPIEKIDLALKILNEVYRSHPMTFDVLIAFNRFADSSLNIQIVHWWNSTVYKEYLDGMQTMNLDIKRRFDQAGIQFAFPSRTVYLRPSPEGQPAEFPSGNGAGQPSFAPHQAQTHEH